jgi:hypothetical protein
MKKGMDKAKVEGKYKPLIDSLLKLNLNLNFTKKRRQDG